MRIYVSGPVAGPEGCARRAIEEARRRLADVGYTVVVPSDAVPAARDDEGGRSMRARLSLMLGCAGLAQLPGWDASSGARLEETVAARCGMPCAPVSAWERRALARGRRPERGRSR